MNLEPLLEHHQYPYHGSIVRRVLLQLCREPIDEIVTENASTFQIRNTVKGYRAQSSVLDHPWPERKSEPVLPFVDHGIGQKPAQSFLEEIPQRRSPQLQMR